MATRNISPNGRKLVQEFEGLRLRAYPDPGTKGAPWTIGYGHTGPEVHKGMSITRERAEALLAEDLQKHEQAVSDLTRFSHTPQESFDALVSFDFNTGALHRSTLLKRHRAGLHDAAAREFHRWKYAGGRVLPGLVRRRAAEAALYLAGFAAPDAECAPHKEKRAKD